MTVQDNRTTLHRIPQLDGWRGISILCVLATHMLPLGPKVLRLNGTFGPMGMSLFFTLSGFLITSFLIRRPKVTAFLVRRLCRILPLAYGYLIITLTYFGASVETWVSNFLFLINYNHAHIIPALHNSHFWSLCNEMHFYLAVALIVAVAGSRGLYVIPVLCLAITGLRIFTGTPINIMTHLRADEILAGGTLALCYAKWIPLPRFMKNISPWLWWGLLFAASHPLGGPLMYLRPYLGAMLVGSTLYQPQHWLSKKLGNRVLKYIAEISYALYVIHPVTMHGWLNTGDTWTRYLIKRPISFALTFFGAHMSTYYWEMRWTRLGRMITASRQPAVVNAGTEVEQPAT